MKTRTMSLRLVSSLIAAFVLLSPAGRGLCADDHLGTIWGTARGVAGAPVAGVKISITNGDVFVSAVTSSDGTYVLASVKPGVYTLTAELAGYQKAERSQVAVAGDQRVLVDFSLLPANRSDGQTRGKQVDSQQALASSSYSDAPQFKPSAVTGSIDPGGYSSPGQARTGNQLVQSLAGLKPDSSFSGSAPTINPSGAKNEPLAMIEPALKEAVKQNPNNFEANHNLGEFYFHSGKLLDGIPYMEKAQGLEPSNSVGGYDLALAYLGTQNYAKARQQIQAMLRHQDSAGLHSLLADVEEQAGNYLTAADEYQRAAQMEPSEDHIFDWGSELLLHQSFEPAIEVFTRGAERYTRSPKLNIGLGVALYSRGNYEGAVKALCAAADLDPTDPRPYLFLGKMYNISTTSSSEIRERLARFAQLQPNNAPALYYYAMSLWKGQAGQSGTLNFDQIEFLLKDAIARDPKFPEAHLELGNLYAEQGKYPEAVQEYKQAIRLQPGLVDAHYRLAQAYTRTGEQTLAQEEFELHGRLRKQQMAETEKQRTEIQQFVYSVKESPKP